MRAVASWLWGENGGNEMAEMGTVRGRKRKKIVEERGREIKRERERAEYRKSEKKRVREVEANRVIVSSG